MQINKLIHLILGCVVCSGTANAAVEGFSFTDTNLSAKYSEASVINPQADSMVYLSGGLDNKLTLSVINTSGVTVFSNTTDFVRVSDRINFSGRDFYGKSISIPKLADGIYSLHIETINSAGKTIDEYTKEIVVDTEGPNVGDWYGNGTGSYGAETGSSEIWWLNTQNSGEDAKIWVTDVKGAVSGNIIVKKLNSDSVVLTRPMIIDQAAFKAVINAQTDLSSRLPSNNATEPYSMQAQLYDAAGNITRSPVKTFYYDNYSGAPSAPYAVFDPDASAEDSVSGAFIGFVVYKPGMTVKTNPVRLLYRVPVDNVRDAGVKGGLAFANSVGSTNVTVDSEYGYFDITAPFGYYNANQIKWVDFGRWIAGTILYDLKLSESATKTPVLTSATFLLNDVRLSLTAGIMHQNVILPATMTNFELQVQPRDYVQRASFRGQSCDIPAGESICSLTGLTYEMTKGGYGYLHDAISVVSVGLPMGTLYANYSYGESTYNDAQYPQLTSFKVDSSTNTLTAFVFLPGAGSWFERLVMKSARIKYGAQYLNPSRTIRNGGNWEYDFNLNSLPTGNHALELEMKENHGPTTVTPLQSFKVENAAPTITITNSGSSVFNDIVGLEDLVVSIVDESSYTIDSVIIAGGSANDTVYLATVSKGNNEYTLQYPRLFPSLSSGEIYTLTVRATDVFGNQGVSSKSFTYQPPNIVNVGSLTTLAVSKDLASSADKPVSEVVINDLRTVESQLASGPQAALFTLRTDAEISVQVLGQVVKPGQTVTLNPVATSGVVKFSVYPAVSGQKGKAQFLFEILEVKSSI
ncbi:Ig-like domain-containing protein [Shewanella sp. GD04112]|uniref:Ig-like domain-containing protein n=1 Tax=Shewanella sp. GD04112 TaxID=2975434 RepID=UPI00244A2571|nr:Ig-like domain-containing protein [Shewanella sp. GD04112]MDH0450887.1 Ig-like domain-containing protein [Shewanella sp. GD04112]